MTLQLMVDCLPLSYSSGVVGVASDRDQRTKQVKHIQFLTTEKMGAGSGKDSGKESSGYPKEDSEGTSLQGVKRDNLPSFDEPVKDDREESVKYATAVVKEKEEENAEEEKEVSQTVVLKKRTRRG